MTLRRIMREYHEYESMEKHKNYLFQKVEEDWFTWTCTVPVYLRETRLIELYDISRAFYLFAAHLSRLGSENSHLYLPKEILRHIGNFLFPYIGTYEKTVIIHFPSDYPFKPPSFEIIPNFDDPIGIKNLIDCYNRVHISQEDHTPAMKVWNLVDRLKYWMENHDNDLVVTGGYNNRCRKSLIRIFETISEGTASENPIIPVIFNTSDNNSTTLSYCLTNTATSHVFGCYYWLNHYKTIITHLHRYKPAIVSEKRYVILEYNPANLTRIRLNLTEKNEILWKRNSCGSQFDVYVLPYSNHQEMSIQSVNGEDVSQLNKSYLR
jgi:ubiquitin-protein ligase